MAPGRRRVDLSEPPDGWDHPWPNVFELARALPTSKWTLVGGLLVQAHAIAHGINAIRPTTDLDVLLHIEIERRPMFAVEGGTQALLRTLIYVVQASGGRYELSVPDELGALVLNGVAHTVDAREAERHLFDAAVLAACVADPVAERARLRGSDRKRLVHLAQELADPRHRAWLVLDETRRVDGQDALRILTAESRTRRFS